jgi:hypothetical protein
MALSELPASGETISVVLASGDRVILRRPASIARRHVWSLWSRLSQRCQRSMQERWGRARGAIGRREGAQAPGGARRDRLALPF